MAFRHGGPKRRWPRLTIAAAVCLAILAVFGTSQWLGGAEEYARFPSPDRRHALVVYRQPQLFAMPGQASDAPGRVVLLDARGNVLNERAVDMVQLVSPPVWSETRVTVKLLLEWRR